tara:strand:- start:1422 stop:1709 length:288 start_codon:yes stop_codon:yes gene_type:complete
MTNTKPNLMWLEIEYTADTQLLKERIDKLNQFASSAGLLFEGQEFFLYEHKGQKYFGFQTGSSGTFTHSLDWGHWFNLDYHAAKNAPTLEELVHG